MRFKGGADPARPELTPGALQSVLVFTKGNAVAIYCLHLPVPHPINRVSANASIVRSDWRPV